MIKITQKELKNLEDEVIEYWNDNGIEWQTTEHFSSLHFPPEGMWESEVALWAEEVLESPELMAQEIGFNNLQEYLNERRAE